MLGKLDVTWKRNEMTEVSGNCGVGHANSTELTVCINVDSALATKTKTSASKQNWSIHVSRSGLMSMPGLRETRNHVPEQRIKCCTCNGYRYFNIRCNCNKIKCLMEQYWCSYCCFYNISRYVSYQNYSTSICNSINYRLKVCHMILHIHVVHV